MRCITCVPSFLALVVLTSAVAVQQSNGTAESTKVAGEEAAVAQDVQAFMQAKLKSSNEALEGLATGDFHKIKAAASRMIEMSKKTMWQQSQTPVYTQYTTDFVSNAQHLMKAANAEDLRGATFAFSQLTVRCYDCHAHVRSDKVATLSPMREDVARLTASRLR